MKHFVEGDKFLLDEKYFGSFVDPHHQYLGVSSPVQCSHSGVFDFILKSGESQK